MSTVDLRWNEPLDGLKVAWNPGKRPPLVAKNGHLYLLFFKDEEVLRKTHAEEGVPFEEIKTIASGRPFFDIFPRRDGEQEIKLVVVDRLSNDIVLWREVPWS